MTTSVISDEVSPPGIGALLRLAWEQVTARIHEAVHDAGYDDLRPAHLRFLGWPEPRRVRPTVMAARAGVSKQAASQLLAHLQDRGYVELVPDPDDERARLVVLTGRGEALVQTVRDTVAAVEEEWAGQLGRRRYDTLRGALVQLNEGRVG